MDVKFSPNSFFYQFTLSYKTSVALVWWRLSWSLVVLLLTFCFRNINNLLILRENGRKGIHAANQFASVIISLHEMIGKVFVAGEYMFLRLKVISYQKRKPLALQIRVRGQIEDSSFFSCSVVI